MPDTEELKIVVSLDDQATAKLQQLRQTVLGSFSGQGMEKLKKDQAELGKGFKDLIELSTGGERAMLGFIGKLTAAGGAIAAVGYTVSDVAKKIYDAANKAKAFGIDPAEFVYIQEQFKKVGVSGEAAARAIYGLNKTIVDISHPGSMKWVEMLHMAGQAGGQAVESLAKFRQQLLLAHTEAQRLNALQQAGQNIYANRLAADMRLVRQGIESVETARMDAADAENVWLGKVANTDRDTIERMHRIAEMTDAAHKKYDTLIDDANKYEQAVIDLGVASEDAGKFLLTAFGPELAKTIHQDAEDIKGIIDLLDKAEAKWREWTGQKDTKPGEAPKFSNFTSRLIDQGYLYLNPIAGAKNLAEKWLTPGATPAAQHFGGGMDAAIGAAGAVGNQFRHTNWDKFSREARASTNIEYAASYFGGAPFADTGGGGAGGVTARGRLLDDNTKELKRLNDQLFQILNPVSGAQGFAGFGGGGGGGGTGAGGGGLAGTPSGGGNIGPSGSGGGGGGGGPGPGSTPGGSDGRITPSAFSFPEAGRFGAGVSGGGKPTASAAAPYADITQGAWGAGPSAAGLGTGNALAAAGARGGGGVSPIQTRGGKVDAQSLYRSAVQRFRGSPLDGYVPADGAKFGITKGTPEEWARLATAVGMQESGLQVNPKSTEAGSAGLYQFGSQDLARRGLGSDVTNVNAQLEATAREFEQARKSGIISGQSGGHWVGPSRYFGSLRRPNETLQHMGQAERVAQAAGPVPGGAAPPGGGTFAWGGTASGTGIHSQSGPAGDPTVPADILARAREVAITHGSGGVAAFMKSQGYPKAGSWCGEFAASVVKSAGYTPPKHPEVASNWRTFGTPDPTPHPGDVAVAGRGVRTGALGSHVTFVEGIDPKTGTFTGLGGNQRAGFESRFRTGGYQFFRPPALDGSRSGTAVASGDDVWKNAPAGGSTLSFGDEDRNAIDRGGVRHHRVSAEGNLRVHVNAPAGTHVAAEGKGLFKQVHLHRQMQMMAAAGAAGMDHRTTPAARVADRFGVYEAGSHAAGG